MENRVFSVADLTAVIKGVIESEPVLSSLLVRGELSNYKIYPSGHHYFTLKDQDASIRCVMFKSSASKLAFRPENGMKVIVGGSVKVYERDGAYQLYASSITIEGIGDLHVAFEQLKEKLYKEGLFDSAHKKPLPRYPERIAVITSSAGAAVRDVIRVLGKRFPMAKVIVMPVRVQGTEAPREIVGAINYANKYEIADLIITGRGGGSIEDLWAFNEEIVARAIYDSKIPVISAVGHEPDVTISDYVADVRAATPSNGAELAVPDASELYDALGSYLIRARQALDRDIKAKRAKVADLASKRVLTSPVNYIEDKRILLDHVQTRLGSAADAKILRSRAKFVEYASKLDTLSPLKVLGRGYSVASREDGKIVRSKDDVKSGDKLSLQLEKDEIKVTVD